MKVLDLSERYLIYITEQLFLMPISIMVAYSINIKPGLLCFFLSYKTAFSNGFHYLFTTASGWESIGI